jgi:hypothetical protein
VVSAPCYSSFLMLLADYDANKILLLLMDIFITTLSV